jgi:RNA polymerase sigma-70 factor (ECF subfamily)
MNDDDAELVAAIRDGSERAFNVLIDRHQQAVRAFLRRLVGNVAEADDIAQDTFLAAWTQLRSFRGETSVRSWLCGIAWRKAKAAQRSWVRGRRRDTVHHEQRSAAASESTGAPIEDRLAVRQALLALPLEQRAAVTLCLVCGCSHSEASAIIGVPLGTVKSHVSRGRDRLRQALERES